MLINFDCRVIVLLKRCFLIKTLASAWSKFKNVTETGFCVSGCNRIDSKLQLTRNYIVHIFCLLPNYFRNMFTFVSQLHSHYSRNCNLYYIPSCRTNIRNFSIRFQGPKFFNFLSPEIQNIESIHFFGKRLKKFLLS